MLILDSIVLRVAGKLLIDNASLTLPKTMKAGLVGPNGSGKSSLFRAILGELSFEKGDVILAKHTKIATIEQEIKTLNQSPLDYVLSADIERLALLEEAEMSNDPERIAKIHERLIALDAYSAKARASFILSGLGFTEHQTQQPLAQFSSGWRMRAALGRLLFLEPHMLLLDEPTNYLDLEANLWLINFLKNYTHSALIISHDRSLLNKAVDSIIHLDHKKLTLWNGCYDLFVKQHFEQKLLQEKAAKRQNLKRQHMENFIARFKAKASKAKQAQSRMKALEKLTEIAIPSPYRATPFFFQQTEKKLTSTLITLENVDIGYQDEALILKNLNLRIEPNDRIALLGINGSGKSTFTQLLIGAIKPKKGICKIQTNLKIALFSQKQMEDLPDQKTVYEYGCELFPEETQSFIRSKIAQMGLSTEKMDTKIQHLSGGEKTRLALGSIIHKDTHFLILDEPTNHLDIESCEALITALNQFEGAILVICHDRYFLEMTMDQLWVIDEQKLTPFIGDLDDYATYILSKNKKNRQKPIHLKTENTINKQAQRKISAQKRTDNKELKKEIQQLESHIENLQKDLMLIDQKLANETLYVIDKDKFLSLSQNRKIKEQALHKAEDDWLIKYQDYEAQMQ